MKRFWPILLLPLLGGANDCDGPSGDADAGNGDGDAGTPDDASPMGAPVRFDGTAQTKSSFGACLPDEMPFVGFHPLEPGPHPLFIWSVGTFATFDSEDVIVILRAMAERGFVAVSSSYDNSIVNGCNNVREKAMCLFSPTHARSLVALACSRTDVDCARGIVVGGHSQGSGISLIAKNYEPRVQAAFGLGSTCDYLFDTEGLGLCDPAGTESDTACLTDAATELPAARTRLIVGEADEYGAPNPQAQLENQSGRECAAEVLDCLTPSGSGWYRVPNSALEDGIADHCLIVNSAPNEFCPGIDADHPFDSGWLPPATEPWSIGPNLDWLASFVD